ncbi:MAG: hypothetical protein Q7K16_01690 [Candidatus Azambacteria bacterium]|nr:hypothetical protein [Candidatus Azambacteria bacterium]
MKKNLKTTITLSFIMSVMLIGINNSSAAALATSLKGKILLQAESKGEAWYVNPSNETRYYLGRPADAFRVMRELGLGITNKDFASFNGYAPSRLSGKILLKVEDGGKAYYVNPVDLKIYYLGGPADAFRVMRELGLGITDKNLSLIGKADDETVSWRIYTNKLYNFTLSFPKNYSYCFDDQCDASNYTSYNEYNISYFSFQTHPEYEPTIVYKILPRKNNLNTTAVKFGEKIKTQNKHYYIANSAKEIIFAEQKAYSFNVDGGFEENGVVYDKASYAGKAIAGVKIGSGTEGIVLLGKHRVIYFDKNGILYRFIYPLDDSNIEKIITTFKFVN